LKKIFLGSVLACLSLYNTLQADIFVKGASNVGFSLGAATSYGNNYTLLGVSGNYFVVDNVSVAGYYRGWFGASPEQHELSVGINYFLPLAQKFRPYGGVFVRENFVSGYDNFGAYGIRGGVSLVQSTNSYISFGYAYERYTNCHYDGECSNSYPEIVAGFSF